MAKVYDPTRKEVWKEASRELTLFGKTYTFWFPKLNDPRIVQIAILTTVTLLGQLVFHFHIRPLQILTVVVTSVVLDLLLTYVTRKIIIFPASGFISSLSMALMLQTQHPKNYIVYVLAGVLAIGSKYLITFDKRHVFNPSNFAIVLLLFAFPVTVTINPDEWRTSLLLISPILLLGTRLIVKAKVYAVALSFLAVEGMFFALYSLTGSLSIFQMRTHLEFSLLSPSILIFTFFMITDPRTVPKSQIGKVLFGGIIGVLHWLYLSLLFHNVALFLALFTMSLTVPVINRVVDKLER